MEHILNDYRQRINLARQEANKYKKLANTYSLARLIIFGLMIAATCFAVINDSFMFLSIAIALLLVAFMWLVSRQGNFERLRTYYQNLEKVNDNELQSILNYGNLYHNGQRFASDKHFYSADLDIFGPASLFNLVNRAATGTVKLAGWLGAFAPKNIILSRQAAVKELATKNDFKLDIQARLLFALSLDANHLQNLFAYLRTPLNLPGEKWLAKYVKIAPWLLLAAIIGAVFYPLVKTLAILMGLVNIGIVFSKAFYIKKADLIAGKIGDTLNSYAIVFEKIEAQQWQADYNAGLAGKLKTGCTSAKIKELSSLINKLNAHLNVLVGFVLNLFLLWDIRQIIAIENWKPKRVLQ